MSKKEESLDQIPLAGERMELRGQIQKDFTRK